MAALCSRSPGRESSSRRTNKRLQLTPDSSCQANPWYDSGGGRGAPALAVSADQQTGHAWAWRVVCWRRWARRERSRSAPAAERQIRQAAGANAIDPFDALQTLAEVAIGVAGFTGVISIFRRRSGGEDALSAWRTSTILTTSLASLLLSTLPMGLALSGLQAPGLWRVCSGAYIVIAVLVIADVVRRRSLLPSDARTVVLASRQYAVFLYVVGGGAVVSQILTVHPSLVTEPAGSYFFATLALIGTSCIIFVRTLFGPHHDP